MGGERADLGSFAGEEAGGGWAEEGGEEGGGVVEGAECEVEVAGCGEESGRLGWGVSGAGGMGRGRRRGRGWYLLMRLMHVLVWER